MKYSLLLAALLTTSAFANELMATNPETGDKVWISDQPCSIEVIKKRLPEKLREHVWDARVEMKEKGQTLNFKACWGMDRGAAHLLYEDGDEGIIPLEDFNKEEKK